MAPVEIPGVSNEVVEAHNSKSKNQEKPVKLTEKAPGCKRRPAAAPQTVANLATRLAKAKANGLRKVGCARCRHKLGGCYPRCAKGKEIKVE